MPSEKPYIRLTSMCKMRRITHNEIDNHATECGVPSARVARAHSGVEGLPRTAQPGDWPWHAALLRAHVHACDAALVHASWLLTTASCFQVYSFFLSTCAK